MVLKGDDQSFSIFSNFSKSKKTDGQSQLRRPDLSYGSIYKKSFLNDFFGALDLNINYKFTTQHVDVNSAGGRIKMKSTDIVNMSISKNLSGNVFSLNFSNLLNERYERPATYQQDGRQIRFGFRKIF